jgi:hypothetical protein
MNSTVTLPKTTGTTFVKRLSVNKLYVLWVYKVTHITSKKVLAYKVHVNHIVDDEGDKPKEIVVRKTLAAAVKVAKEVTAKKTPRKYTYKVSGIQWDHPNPRSENLHSSVTVKHTSASALNDEVVRSIETAYHTKINYVHGVERID